MFPEGGKYNFLKGIDRIIKRAILVIILLTPVVLFLFLKYCGVNHYAVPVFYRHGTGIAGTDCNTDTGQYRIGFFPFYDAGENACDTSLIRGHYTVLMIPDTAQTLKSEREISNLTRVLQDINDPPAVQAIIIRVGQPSGLPQKDEDHPDDPVKILYGSGGDVFHFARCGLILPPDSVFSKMVLVDESGRIRGYYQNDRFDESDRLTVEIKILLKEEYGR